MRPHAAQRVVPFIPLLTGDLTAIGLAALALALALAATTIAVAATAAAAAIADATPIASIALTAICEGAIRTMRVLV